MSLIIRDKIALIFSAMRHFASEMRARGFRVLYRTLDDPDNQGSLRPRSRSGPRRRAHVRFG